MKRLKCDNIDSPFEHKIRRLGKMKKKLSHIIREKRDKRWEECVCLSTRTNAQIQQGCFQLGKVLMLASYLTAESVDDTTLTHALLLVTTVERQDIRPKTAELHLALQTKEDPEAKEDREVMLFVSNVVRRDITRTSVRTIEVKAVETKFEATNKILRTIKGKIKETLKEITKHQPALKEDAEHLAKYTAYLRQVCEDAKDHASNAQEEARQKRKETLEEVMLDQLIATRVAEALIAAVVTHAASNQEETNLGSNSSQNKACNYKEFRVVMHENFRGTEGAVGLTR
ncbi:hypothetical protein Tco_0769922 [Tanacetum coccineum]|uniref:Uncharacterized protein n=1 Tax=Tanacetum coccineum TaxID=301880 RepID=A0ABQ4ZDC2_9ASTR